MFRFLVLLVVSCSLSVVCPTRAQESKSWKAGVAKVVITPEKLMWMSGYGARDKPAQGKRTDLWAKALVLEDAGGKRGVLVTMDLVGIDRGLSVAVCNDLHKTYGLDRASIILSTSHTHCGPVVRSNLNAMYNLDETQQQLVRAYSATLHQKLVKLVGEAIKDVRPGKLSWGIGEATFAVNRRNNKEGAVPKLKAAGALKGPVDHNVPVLAIRTPGGELRAVIFGYACHATTLSFYEWCADYPGYAQTELEKAYPGATALFFAGCGADQNPLPRRTVELAEKYGRELAEAVQLVLNKTMTPVKGSLRSAYTEIDLPFAELPTREKLAQDLFSKNKFEVNRAKLLLKQLEEKGSLRGNYPYPVQVWTVGSDIDWIALGGEVVVDFSLRLKKENGPGKTWVMGYANDVMAYIPSLRVLKEGGYEGGGAMVIYGLPTIWGAQVEERIVAAVHEQIKKAREN